MNTRKSSRRATNTLFPPQKRYKTNDTHIKRNHRYQRNNESEKKLDLQNQTHSNDLTHDMIPEAQLDSTLKPSQENFNINLMDDHYIHSKFY